MDPRKVNMEGFFEYGNEPSSSIKGGDFFFFLAFLIDCKFSRTLLHGDGYLVREIISGFWFADLG